jgi:hypothetical protein
VSAQFVSLAVAYALGGGVMRRKGAARRPWLELQRLETESAYLGHQVRALRKAGRASVRAIEDMRPGRFFYDCCRARIQSPLLERAVEILGCGERQRITGEALAVAGLRGLGALWLDAGAWEQDAGRLWLRSAEEAALVSEYLERCRVPLASASENSVLVRPLGMRELADQLRPAVHRSMRHALRPGSRHGATLLGRNLMA